MAEPICDLPASSSFLSKSPQDEWQDTLQLLHERGIFRLIQTSLEALPDITSLLVGSVDNPFGKNTLANVMLFAGMLGKIDPATLMSFTEALAQAMQKLQEPPPQEAPGFMAMLHLLRDRQLWQTVQHFAEVLKTFHASLQNTHANQ
jgi:uncharacterized protein YjgD (DUF1641 family)